MYQLDTQPSFILSTKRAGSTLLRILLDTHPDIWSPDEIETGSLAHSLVGVVGADEEVSPSEIDPATASESDSADATSATGGYDYARAAHHAPIRDRTREMFDQLMTPPCRARDTQIWCDKSPANHLHADLLETLFPDGKFVCLSRHPIDTVASLLNSYGHKGWPLPLRDFVFEQPNNLLAAMTEYWLTAWDGLASILETNPDRALLVKYEEFVADPESVLEDLEGLFDLSFPDDLVEQMFETSHFQRPGHGDGNVFFDHEIKTDRLGKGRRLDWTGRIDTARIDRLNDLLARLDYPPLDPRERDYQLGVTLPETRDSSPEASQPSRDLEQMFENRLEARQTLGEQLGLRLQLEVTDPDDRVFVMDLSASTLESVPPDRDTEVDLVVRADAPTWTAILNGELNPAVAARQHKLVTERNTSISDESVIALGKFFRPVS